MISGLQPYTIHKFQIRCGAAKHFWKWSEWSKDLTITTKEAGEFRHREGRSEAEHCSSGCCLTNLQSNVEIPAKRLFLCGDGEVRGLPVVLIPFSNVYMQGRRIEQATKLTLWVQISPEHPRFFSDLILN